MRALSDVWLWSSAGRATVAGLCSRACVLLALLVLLVLLVLLALDCLRWIACVGLLALDCLHWIACIACSIACIAYIFAWVVRACGCCLGALAGLQLWVD